jgi:hypothetical protein
MQHSVLLFYLHSTSSCRLTQQKKGRTGSQELLPIHRVPSSSPPQPSATCTSSLQGAKGWLPRELLPGMALAAARVERPATAARGWFSRRPWRIMYVGGLPHEISCRRQASGELLLWERARGRVAPPSRSGDADLRAPPSHRHTS